MAIVGFLKIWVKDVRICINVLRDQGKALRDYFQSPLHGINKNFLLIAS